MPGTGRWNEGDKQAASLNTSITDGTGRITKSGMILVEKSPCRFICLQNRCHYSYPAFDLDYKLFLKEIPQNDPAMDFQHRGILSTIRQVVILVKVFTFY